MKYTISIIVLLNSLVLFGQTPANDPHWELVWQDDFNTFDASKWLKVDWAQHGEPQLYLASNVSTSGGNLVIKVDNDTTYCPPNPPTVWGGCWPCDNQFYYYTSGWVETQPAYNTQYGYVESRIKLPFGYGFWPAFWTFKGAGTNSANAGEIDIFEMLGSKTSSVLTTNYHHDYCDASRPDYDPNTGSCSGLPDNHLGLSPLGFNWDGTWHTYGIEWSPDKIIWYIDGYTARIFNQTGQTDPVTGEPIFPIDPLRIILNLAIEPWAPPNPSTPFPSEMKVDYVKVYELDNDCTTNLNACNYNFSNHDNKVKKNITIGTAGCSNSLSNGDNVHMRASDGILINGDFTVPVGAQLYLDVNGCY